MNQDNQALSVLPDKPGLWWAAETTAGQPDVVVEVFKGSTGLRYYEHGHPESEPVDARVKWLGPVISRAESEANRKALVESRRVFEAIRQFAIIHRDKPSVIDFGAALTQIERACIKALELP